MDFRLTFKQFQDLMAKRDHDVFGSKCNNPEFLSIALAGETGEMCNIVKKVLRGDFTYKEAREDILNELADIICYAVLMMDVFNEDTGDRVVKKFNEVSARFGWVGK